MRTRRRARWRCSPRPAPATTASRGPHERAGPPQARFPSRGDGAKRQGGAMKYIDEFRDGTVARALARRIGEEARPGRRYNLMEFCGGHTHAISRYGIKDLLPDNVEMIHGPGCPVCVLPIGRIDNAIELATEKSAIVCTYADTMRVPASGGLSLMKAKARGADIRMIYSAADALKIAQENPTREVVFFAIGFETTTPPTAIVIRQAQARRLAKF